MCWFHTVAEINLLDCSYGYVSGDENHYYKITSQPENHLACISRNTVATMGYLLMFLASLCTVLLFLCVFLFTQVELKFDIEKGTPDTDVTMSVKASPDSLCAYGTVDKSVYLKGGDNQLSQARISEMLQSYTLHEWSG